MSGELDLLDWKRRVFELYAEVRATDDPEQAWRRWRAVRDELFRDHPQSPSPGYTGLDYFPYDRVQPVLRVRPALGLPAHAAGEPARCRAPGRGKGSAAPNRVIPCYGVPTDGNGPSREISASRSSFGGFELCDLEPHSMKESNMQEGFKALGVSAAVEHALAARGIVEPFRIQSLVLPDALAGRDVLGKAPTGSGKTIAFGIPLVERTPIDGKAPSSLVLVPTRELALQVAEEIATVAAAKGVRVAVAYGGAPVAAQAKRLRGAEILVATPGRLYDLMERRLVSLDGVQVLVLDEADRMLDMGFRPQVERIVRRIPEDRQTMLFSATLDGEVGDLATEYTRDASRYEYARAVEANDGVIEHDFVSVTADDKIDRLLELLDAEEGLSLVFVRTKRGADRLMQKLARRGVVVVAMHGDMVQSQRERALAQFRDGHATTLVATDVAARGLDLEAISHVINFDPPEDDKGYVHRVGRTGRAGRSGRGSTLVLPEQQADVSRVAARLGHREQFERTGMPSARSKLVYTSRRGRSSRW